MLKLFSYFRSSAAYRVRIALNFKGLPYEILPVHLLRDGGQQKQANYLQLNPIGLVPTLLDGNIALTQSLSIIEYLEESYPNTIALLPTTPTARARVRALALTVACEVHPLNNLRVVQYLRNKLSIDDVALNAWYRHWVSTGLDAMEQMLCVNSATGRFCHGDNVSIADCFLVPQVFNARRFNVPMDRYPTIARIETACLALDAFRNASPEAQPDAE